MRLSVTATALCALAAVIMPFPAAFPVFLGLICTGLVLMVIDLVLLQRAWRKITGEITDDEISERSD